MRSPWCFLALVICLPVSGCHDLEAVGPEAAAPSPFEDRAPGSGVDFALRCARGDKTSIRDTIGHGVAVIDYDQDGLQDLVFAGPDRVEAFRNLGGFRFERRDLGLRQRGSWGGFAIADVDGNGWPDLYAAGYGCAALYLNEKGRFRDVTQQSGLSPSTGAFPAWGSSAGFADLDGDQRVDLVVCHYLEFDERSPQRCPTHLPTASAVCPPKVYAPQFPRFHRNLGAGRFQDATAAWGLKGHGSALGVAFQDLDGDGAPEIAIANDERPSDLFSRKGARWTERGADSGIAYDREGRVYAGMGVDWGDFNGDQRPDLAATSFYGEVKPLFLNLGEAVFQEASSAWGAAAAGLTDVAFGVRALDWDNDGRQDLMVANGHIQENAGALRREAAYLQPIRLFHNVGSRFVTAYGGWPAVVGRALATADLDNDGGMDAVATNLEGQPLLLRNTASRGHWLGLRLMGRAPNSMALGAQVAIRAGGRTQMREVHTAGSYMSANDARVHFGLGSVAEVERVRIRWPSGKITIARAPEKDRWLTVREGSSSER